MEDSEADRLVLEFSKLAEQTASNKKKKSEQIKRYYHWKNDWFTIQNEQFINLEYNKNPCYAGVNYNYKSYSENYDIIKNLLELKNMTEEECAILIAEAAALEEQHEAEINKQGELRREAHNRVVEKSKKIKKIIENENKKKSEHEDMKRYTREALEAYKATQKAPKDLTYRQ